MQPPLQKKAETLNHGCSVLPAKPVKTDSCFPRLLFTTQLKSKSTQHIAQSTNFSSKISSNENRRLQISIRNTILSFFLFFSHFDNSPNRASINSLLLLHLKQKGCKEMIILTLSLSFSHHIYS